MSVEDNVAEVKDKLFQLAVLHAEADRSLLRGHALPAGWRDRAEQLGIIFPPRDVSAMRAVIVTLDRLLNATLPPGWVWADRAVLRRR